MSVGPGFWNYWDDVSRKGSLYFCGYPVAVGYRHTRPLGNTATLYGEIAYAFLYSKEWSAALTFEQGGGTYDRAAIMGSARLAVGLTYDVF